MAQPQPTAVQPLPPEIVLAIVKTALEGLEYVRLLPWRRYNDEIRLELNRLRRISRHWDNVITGCPTLWRDILMNLRNKDTTLALEAEYHRFRLCVERCNDLPRNLHLVSPGAQEWRVGYSSGSSVESISDTEDDSDGDSEGSSVSDNLSYIERRGLASLILSFAKWGHIHVVLENYVTFAWNILCRQSYPHKTWEWLEALTLESEEMIDLPESGRIHCSDIILVAENFPALRQVALNLTQYSVDPWNFLWGQLTKLTLENFVDRFGTYLNILGQCKVLEEFHLTVGEAYELWNEAPIVEQSPLAITLPYLRKLSLKITVASDVVEEFINRLTLPALERFTLAFRDSSGRHTNGQDPFISPLLDLVRRSQCFLLHLSLESFLEVDEALFAQLLLSSPSLQCLLFASVRTSLDFLDSVSSISHPTFQQIEITNRGCDPDEEVINRFAKWANCWVKGAGLDDEDVLSRRKEVISALYQHVATLKDIGGEVILPGHGFPEPMGIEALKEEGWNVDVVYWAPGW
ncbi:hypothetical protein D9611_002149 [Ephemerocybe angulata]|uniref:F-box domain-containing protein n=1 Tax=Ephemerocybe angulata TaxID=980116 RepID=A0A8H5FLZ6_9AGAR|nr:hypothetical protein D9611_002149 [Tulosesus angulatus]